MQEPDWREDPWGWARFYAGATWAFREAAEMLPPCSDWEQANATCLERSNDSLTWCDSCSARRALEAKADE